MNLAELTQQDLRKLQAKCHVFGPYADDAFGDAMLAACQHYRQERGDLSAFVAIVARNRAINYNRNQRAVTDSDLDTTTLANLPDPWQSAQLERAEESARPYWLLQAESELKRRARHSKTLGERLHAQRGLILLSRMAAIAREDSPLLFAGKHERLRHYQRVLAKRGHPNLSLSTIEATLAYLRKIVAQYARA
jgi:DNA-directed RNA polymerase specialized sigma24 family protein